MAEEVADRCLDVLVVDDGPHNRALNRALLESVGCRVTEASSGQEGIAAALEHHFDVVLMDFHMPGIDGRAASARIRALQSASGERLTPVVGLTADESAIAERDWCEYALDKPATAEALRGALVSVAGWIGEPAAEEGYVPAELAAEFIESVVADLGNLHVALTRRDYEAISQVAHSLKGLGASFGFPEISRLGARMERDARWHARKGIERCIRSLRAAVTR